MDAMRSIWCHTVLNPSVTQCMDTFGLMLADNDVANGRARQEVEDSISIRALWKTQYLLA